MWVLTTRDGNFSCNRGDFSYNAWEFRLTIGISAGKYADFTNDVGLTWEGVTRETVSNYHHKVVPIS
jgi:hypothetical protein